MSKVKNFNIKIVLSILILLVFSLFNGYSVQAGNADAKGDRPTVAGSGMWIEIKGENGTSKAWDEFMKRPSAYPNRTMTKAQKVNSMGDGFVRSDGTRESLVESCKRSEYIWYYGNGTDPWTKDGYTYKHLHWYTQGRNTHRAHWMELNRGQLSQDAWQEYLNSPISRWTSGSVVLVCSGIYTVDKPPRKIDLEITANSGTFEYNAKPHTVSGANITSGDLKAGHTYSTTTTRTETNEGKYPVLVTGVSIVDSGGRSVLDQYNVTTKNGLLTIKKKEAPTTEIPDQTVETRCVNPEWTSWLTGPTWLDMIVNPTFQVEDKSLIAQTVPGMYTALGVYANDGKFDNLNKATEWETWKANFNKIKNESNNQTPTLELNERNKDGMSRYGGVLTATARYKNQSFRVELCQPQQRTWTEVKTYRTDENGNQYLYKDESKWGEWTDIPGGKLIRNRQNSMENGDNYHFQMLVVNCNVEDFTAAKNASTLNITESKIGDGRGSSLMTTEPTRNISRLPFGNSAHPNAALRKTGTKAFYTDGTSCGDLFTCTSNLLSSAQHDAKNNSGSAPSFSSSEGEAKSAPDGSYLVFFRDNLDRKVRADVFYPVNKANLPDIFVDSNKAAFETFIEIDKSGTPEMGITTIAPWKDQRDPISGGIEPNKTTAKFNGSINTFTMKAQWSSEENKPHKLAVDWKYLATMKNRVPSRLTRFGMQTTSDIEYTEELPVYCEFKNNPGESKAYYSTQPFSNPNGTQTNPVKPIRTSFENAIRVLFTRSVSDTNK